MKGRLNLFQAMMLRWRELYPYSAVHAVRIEAPLEVPRLQEAIDGQLTALGLTGLELDVVRRRFEYRGGPAHAALAILPGTADPAGVLRREMARQLNAPFPHAGRIDPFRFFAVDRGGSFDLGLAYDHFVAAGDSIVLLLKTIVDRYRDGAAARVPPQVPDLYPATYRRMFLRDPVAFLRGMRRVPAMVKSFRHSFRPRYPRGQDGENAVTQFRLDRPLFDALLRTTKDWGITLNDLMLSIVLQAVSPLAEDRHRQRRRNELGIASIVNIRRDCGADVSAAFGQFLSSFLLSHPVPSGLTLEQLARDIHAKTERIKEEKLYLQTLFAMSVVGLAWRFFSPDQRAHFHVKSHPVWAGMTALNVDMLWEKAGGQAPPTEYLRAVSTGPNAPLVVAVTAAGAALQVGISFRTAAFTHADIDKIVAGVLSRIENLHA